MSAITRAFARASPLKRISTSNIRRSTDHGHGHDNHAPQWNEPGGYLFGEKPLAPGEKRVKEGWEDIYYWGMGGGMLFAAIALYYKPDTSVVTWATKEAEKSLKEKGISLDYPKSG